MGGLAGAVLALPNLGDLLLFYGFWGGLMWILPVVCLAGALVLRIGWKGVRRVLPVGLAAFTGFVVIFPVVTLDPGEGSPVLATAVGGWSAAWLICGVSIVHERLKHGAAAPASEAIQKR